MRNFPCRLLDRFASGALKLLTGFFIFLSCVQLSLAQSPGGLEQPKRIVVKFKAPLAEEVEKALPPSLELEEPERSVRQEWFHKHGVKKLAPLYRELVRQKKKKGVTAPQFTSEIQKKFSRRAKRVPGGVEAPDVSRTYILEFSAGTELEVELAVERLQADPEVEFAQQEQAVQTQFSPNDPYFSSTGSWGQTYSDLWGLYRIQFPAAWTSNLGQGIIVAVVDTGIQANHSDLASNLWTNSGEIPGNGIDDDQNGFIDDVGGWDFVGASYLNPLPDNNPADVHGHGTHVAGTIAAVGNNGLGVVGIACAARVMAVRGLDNNGTGTDAALANAIIYATNNGADVINNSYGGQGFSQVLLDAVNYAHNLGVVVVVAAGNSSVRAETFFPASYANAITVSASTPTDGRSSYSNFGGKVDVAAPGDDILSLRAAGTTRGSIVGTEYTRLSGTSMATPHVAGLAALILAQQSTFSPEQVRQAIRISATDLYLSGFDIYFGWGRINASAALAVNNPLEAKIQSPMEGPVVNGPITFSGVAQGPGFSSYRLEYGATETPSSWTLIQQGTTAVSGGLLGTAELALPDGRHSVRLQVTDTSGRVFSDRMTVTVQYSQFSSPRTSLVPSASQSFKPGTVISLQGTVRGPSLVSYQIEWARGLNATGGWSSTGITLANGGLSPVANGEIAQFSTAGLLVADYYTLRLRVNNGGFVSEVRTTIYLEPDLTSANWPQLLSSTPPGWYGNWSGMIPARNAIGGIRLFLGVGPDSTNPTKAKLLGLAPDGSTAEQVLLQSTNAGFQPAAANIDGNPGDEIIVGDGGSIRIVRPDLSSYSITPAQTVSFQNTRVVVDDLNNDGSSELIALGNGSASANANLAYLYAWKPNGQLLNSNFPIQIANANSLQRDYSPVRFLTVDLNNDGLKEILVAESTSLNTCNLRAFNGDGTPYPWPVLSMSNRITNLVAGDMDNDGSMDIAVGYFNNTATEFWVVLSADGTIKPGWPQSSAPYLSAGSRLALADLSRDGHLQLIVASSIHKIFVFNVDGSSFSSAWPLESYNPGCLTIADVDGDSYPEIISMRSDWVNVSGSGYDDYKLIAYRRDGTVSRFWRILGRDGFASTRDMVPAIGDFRQTGSLDIASWDRLDSYGFGQAMIVSPGVAFNGASAGWPLSYHDAANTCVVPMVSAGAPSVRITSPSDGSVLSSTIVVTATASDDVGVTGVQFKLDGMNLGTELTAAPYELSWDTRQSTNGTHALTAVARDADGRASVSAVTVVLSNDLTAPVVALTSPTNGSTLSGTVNVAANASDNFAVAGVQFQLDGINLGSEDTNAPYTVSWNTLSAANGTHTLSATARDLAGNQASSTISLVVNNDQTAPTVAFTAPANGSTVIGICNVSANAADNVGVTGVQFQIDGVNLGAEDTIAPYGVSWNTQSASNGSHTLRVTARDAAGNSATTTSTVTVSNDLTAPTVALTSPANGSTVAGTISVTAGATDNVAVVGVQFFVDGVSLGAEDTIAPYAATWNTTTFTNGSHALTAVARDAAGNTQTSLVISAIVKNVIKVNFQPASAPTYSDYAPDSGAIYGMRSNGYSYGWNLNNSANSFDRNSTRSLDQRYDTLLTMQNKGTFLWEVGLPNGQYSVHVVAGDANSFNSVYKINVEGVLAVNGTPTSANRWKEGTVTVTVADGRLTISNASGANDNKICFLEITPLP